MVLDQKNIWPDKPIPNPPTFFSPDAVFGFWKPSSSLSLVHCLAARKTAVASLEPAFYTCVIGAAITEQLYKEKYWEDHPGEAVPLLKPKFYGGPWKELKSDALPPND